MLRILLLIFAFLVGRTLFRALLSSRRRSPRTGGRRSRTTPPPQSPTKPAQDPLRDLTQQEISDADFEEIPPEE